MLKFFSKPIKTLQNGTFLLHFKKKYQNEVRFVIIREKQLELIGDGRSYDGIRQRNLVNWLLEL